MRVQQEQPGGNAPGQAAEVPGPVALLISRLGEEVAARCEVDPPVEEGGEWWLDVAIGDYRTPVVWRPRGGFGLFTSPAQYGDRPSEIFREPEQTCLRLSQLSASFAAKQATNPLSLRDLRHLTGASQVQVAERLGSDQAEVSRVERRQDVKLSTLRQYVEALGGRTEVIVRFEGFEGPIVVGGE